MFVTYDDRGVSDNLLAYNGCYKAEEFETKLFKIIVKERMVVVDLGAHFGHYTLIAARKVGDEGRVFAF